MKYPYDQKKEVLNTPAAQGYLLAETHNNDIVELHIAENGEVPAHALPVDVTFYVVSGRGCITIANEKTDAEPGDIITVERNLERAWFNPNTESLKLLVIKQK